MSQQAKTKDTALGAQTGEGYGCACGFKTADRKGFISHLAREGRKEKGVHKSLGRINLQTNEVIMGPWIQRTKEQKLRSTYGQKGKEAELTTRPTDVLQDATQIRFVPRVFTCAYTPIMQMAQACAVNEWKWDSNMNLEDFLDTILYLFFKDRGIILAGYFVEEGGEDHGS